MLALRSLGLWTEHSLSVRNASAVGVVLVALVCSTSCMTESGEYIAIPGDRPLVTVTGAVRNEGNVQCLSGLKVSRAIALVGGSPNGSVAYIHRSGRAILVDLKRLGERGYDPTLEPGDRLQVLADQEESGGNK